MIVKVRRFVSESGFKVLAMARLSQAEYSVILYLLNAAESGLDLLVATEEELGVSLGYEASTIRTAVRSLSDRNLVRLQTAVDPAAWNERTSFSLGMQYDMSRWRLDFAQDATSTDAVIYPFRRLGSAHLQLFQGRKGEFEDGDSQTWQRIVDYFEHGRQVGDDDRERAEEAARMLVETHPVDQILIMLRHFGTRIPTLSLLASSWQHFLELFESETQKIDMLDARQKHHENDEKVRRAAADFLGKMQESESLSEDEVTVLRILSGHRYPRRQLFWAYQSRSRYPKLSSFLEEHASLMLPVTTLGHVVKRPNPE